VPYEEALRAQERFVSQKVADATVPDELWLLEHEPVYTMGRTPDASSLRDETALPHPVIRIGRGGQATYHGPGQLVGYPLLDLKPRGQDLHRHLRLLEEVLIVAVGHLGLVATRREALTGVWVATRKLASIGVGVRRWVSMHGFALNVCGSLEPFSAITPCGIRDVCMTSVSAELGREIPVSEMAAIIAEVWPLVDVYKDRAV
jgi:lipoyl(octanoyl) transferase